MVLIKERRDTVAICIVVILMIIVASGCFSFGGSSGGGIPWVMNDLPAGLNQASSSGKLVLLDFWSGG